MVTHEMRWTQEKIQRNTRFCSLVFFSLSLLSLFPISIQRTMTCCHFIPSIWICEQTNERPRSPYIREFVCPYDSSSGEHLYLGLLAIFFCCCSLSLWRRVVLPENGISHRIHSMYFKYFDKLCFHRFTALSYYSLQNVSERWTVTKWQTCKRRTIENTQKENQEQQRTHKIPIA